MPVSLIAPSYFNDMFGDASMREVFSDENRFVKWLETEVALAVAQEQMGIIPKGTAAKIKAVATLENLVQAEMKADFDKVGFPILPFVHQLTKACDVETARWVHYGATTQDILDTGTVLQMRDGLKMVEESLDAIIQALAELSNAHRDTPMAGRTFQQLAAPITFGYKTAIWLDEMLRHRERIQQLKSRLLVGQCSGAVGTFATLGDKGLEVQKRMMKELGLGVPDISWHVARDTWAELVSDFAMIAATLGKIANEIAILMRSEIGELSEPFETGRGASTTLPQKRNPISCEPIIANAHKMRELVGSQLTSMIQEHERGALGQMHLEWMVIPEAFILLSGALKHTRFILENLVVDAERMGENLNLNGGLIMAEAVMMGIAPKVGKKQAHDLVYGAAGMAYDKGISLKEALLATPEIYSMLSEKEIDSLLDPVNYTGMSGEMVDAVLAKLNKQI
ncbi:MAG: adenylosuccinate lyase family protein [Bacteroidetes bacterium]|nr:MAG: adenylosuccinate lyase family protein [Bacteroidota bacterium]